MPSRNWEVDIILQWTLGWGLRKDALLPPPDFLAGCVVCIWVVCLYVHQRRVRVLAQSGATEAERTSAARHVLLPAFTPMLVRYVASAQWFMV